MHIGLDAHILGKGKGGVERVVHQLVHVLPGLLPEHQFLIFVRRGQEQKLPPQRNVRYCPLIVSDPLIQRSFVLPWLARREKLQLLHVQRAAPPFVRARLIVHTHDLLPLTAPNDHRGWRDRLVRRLTPRSLRRADSVLTVSNSVAQEIRQLFPFAAKKTTAIPNGVEGQFFKPLTPGAARTALHQRLKLTGPYVLYLGALMARKNLVVVVQAFAHYVRSRPPGAEPVKLVLAGMCRSASYLAELTELAENAAPGAICFAGFLTDQECLELLQHAFVFLAPSRGEGFDLPALEAMSCGIPVICSELPVHREMLEDDALFFPPDDSDRLAQLLLQLENEPETRLRLAQQGLQRARRFTWENAMRGVASLYRNLQPSPSHV